MGIPEKIRPCIGCNVGCYGNMVERGIAGGCAVNPRATRELNTRPRKAVNPRKIAVIGGGFLRVCRLRSLQQSAATP